MRDRSWLLLALPLAFAACSGSSDVTGSTTVPSSTTTTETPATTVASTTTGITATIAETDLVVVGDSFVAWAEWPEMLAVDLGVQRGISVLANTDLSAPAALAVNEPDRLVSEPEAIRIVSDSEILVLQPRATFVALRAMEAYVEGECRGPQGSQCLHEGVIEMRAYVDEYLDLVLSLVTPNTEVLVVLTGAWPIDATFPSLRNSEPERHATLVGFVFDLMEQVEESATHRGIGVVDVGATFGGRSYRSLPPHSYLVEDGIHLSEVGSRAVADLLFASLEGHVLEELRPISGLQVGDCFDLPAEFAFSEVPVVDCDTAHDREVLSIYEFEPTAYADPIAASNEAGELCYLEFAALVAASDSDSLDMTPVVPSDDDWEAGVRRVACILYPQTAERLIGSIVASSP